MFEDWNGTRLVLNDRLIHILPDAHLGRRFLNNVPLHRRGERERMVMADFQQRLQDVIDEEPTVHITIGDIFDQPRVDPMVVLMAAEAYQDAAYNSPKTHFVILPGNHDLSRDVEAKTSYDLLRAILVAVKRPNIQVLRDVPEVMMANGLRLGFVPWHPTETSEEMVSQLGKAAPFDAIFGHWDVIAPIDRRNLVPIEVLREMTSIVVTGHDHRRRAERRGEDLALLVTGSMQPYAHGEDVDGTMYRTVTLGELPSDTRNLCLRIMLQGNEEAPTDIDALQVQIMRVVSKEDAKIEVGFGDAFNIETIFADEFEKAELPQDVIMAIRDRYIAGRS